MQIVCPHCRSPVELVPISPRDIVCPSCGSSFRLENEATTTEGGSEDRRTIGRFQLMAVAGVGGFGTVYRAHDSRLDRTVAIKIPRAGSLVGEDSRDRFFREARSVASLQHPSIVQVHEVGDHEGVPYLVSDFIDGVTLSDWLSAHKPTFPQAAELAAKVAEALHYAHEHGVVHRDIKPSNVLLDSQGGPHLTDFGLARRDAGEITVTLEGQVLGTPAYMSPEQARGEAHLVDSRGDVYSLGVILYLLLTGELPFRGTARMLLHQVLFDEPKPPRRLNDKIPRDLETITLKAMAKEPHRRYASARELADDLRRFQHKEPILARPVGRLERAQRWCRRNPALALAGLLAGLSLIALGIVSTGFAIHQSRAADRLRREQARTFEALQQTKKQRDVAENERRNAEGLSIDLTHERGLNLAASGDAARGLLWLARTLSMVPDDQKAIRTAIRTSLSELRADIASMVHYTSTQSEVLAVAYRPDSRAYAMGCRDGTARVLNSADGSQIGPEIRCKGPIRALTFARDGMTIIIASDSEASVWNLAEGKPIGALMQHGATIRALALAPDGKTVLTAGDDGLIRPWSPVDGRVVGKELVQGSPVNAVAVSPDGKSILSGSDDGQAKLWNSNGTPRGISVQHTGSIVAAAFSPDGKFALTGWGDGIAQLWSVSNGRQIGKSLTHHVEITCLAFSPDGRLVATGSYDNTARFWDATDGSPVATPMTHMGSVLCVAFSPDGRRLVTGSDDSSIRMWEVPGPSRPVAELQHQAGVTALALSPDGRSLLTGDTAGSASIWDINSLSRQGKRMIQRAEITSAAFSPDGTIALTSSYDNTACLWSAVDGSPLGKPLDHGDSIEGAAFSPDGKLALTWGDRIARLWRVGDSSPVGAPMVHDAALGSVAISPDSTIVATGCWDRKARLWSTADARPLGRPIDHGGEITKVGFSPDGSLLLTGGMNAVVRIWRVADGSLAAPAMRFHSEMISAAAFSPDGATIVTGSWDQTARLWRAVDGTPVGKPLIHHGAVTSALFSPDGRLVATASWDGVVRLWGSADGSRIGRPLVHGDVVPTIAFRPDGSMLASASRDHRVRLWRTPSVVAGEPARIILWAQVITGMELDQDSVTHILDTGTWLERKRQLELLGGPPGS